MLQNKLDDLCAWSALWQLQIVFKKCPIMSIPSTDSGTGLCLGATTLP